MHPQTLNMLLFLKANRHLWHHASILQEILDEEPEVDEGNEDEGDESMKV